MITKCKKCKHTWNYKGKSLYYTSCPKCRANIKVGNGQKNIKEETINIEVNI